MSEASEGVGPTVNPTARTGVVVLVDSIRRPGGGERLAVEGVIRLDPAKYQRTLCLTRWEDSFETQEPARSILARLREEGVEVLGLRRGSRLDLRAWAPLLRLLREPRTGVVHGHLFGSNLWGTVLGRLCRVPAVIAHEHMWAYTGGRLRPLLDRHVIARFSDAFIAVSEQGRRQMIEVEQSHLFHETVMRRPKREHWKQIKQQILVLTEKQIDIKQLREYRGRQDCSTVSDDQQSDVRVEAPRGGSVIDR